MNPKVDENRLVGILRRVLRDCGRLYRDSGKHLIRRHPTLIDPQASPDGRPPRAEAMDEFAELMEDLHRGLVVKVYVTVVRADARWSGPEKRMAAAMIEYLWDQKLDGEQLRDAATELFQQADRLEWISLVAPFVRYEPLADGKAEVETIVLRLANLIAKCDGSPDEEELAALHAMQRELEKVLYPDDSLAVLPPQPISRPWAAGDRRSNVPGRPVREAANGVAGGWQKASEPTGTETASGRSPQRPGTPAAAPGRTATPPASGPPKDPAKQLASAMAELDALIGLDEVKQRVKSYANFLRLQQQRRDAGLATMPITLHMSFVGNPGTGKTTVARIVGQILGAMGTLQRGHVVEADRSTLVAGYAGQTASQTNQVCDSAVGGVLFIDEAYGLVDAGGDDAYGREALQTLLKRMEDDRDQLVIIFAGYPDEMRQLIESNPGLASRINTTITFPDYGPVDLGRIFGSLCKRNQYRLPAAARHRLLVGLDRLYQRRDRHFGNGRLVRNAFEESVRRLADRVADVPELTETLLTTLRRDDIHVPGFSDGELDRQLAEPHELRVPCSGCQRSVRLQPGSLGRRIRCPKCECTQAAAWATVHWKTPPERSG